jgi:hypothetical protein
MAGRAIFVADTMKGERKEEAVAAMRAVRLVVSSICVSGVLLKGCPSPRNCSVYHTPGSGQGNLKPGVS